MDKHSAILITGAGGVVGKNLCAALRCRGYDSLLTFDIDTPKEALREYAQKAAFVFHLAGVNRPKDPGEFYAGNRGSVSYTHLDVYKRQCRGRRHRGNRPPGAACSACARVSGGRETQCGRFSARGR